MKIFHAKKGTLLPEKGHLPKFGGPDPPPPGPPGSYAPVSILYIKNTNEDTTTIDTALLVFFI
jgi:hypothetical protein